MKEESNSHEMFILPGPPPRSHSPSISVIIPVFNRFHMLRQAVASVLCQTIKDYELIVVDDGSIDETSAIETDGISTDTKGLKKAMSIGGNNAADEKPFHRELLLQKPVAFQYIRLKHTGMPGAVRNRGVDAAKGRFIAFLDSDDLWLPEKLELQLALMSKQPSIGISHTREIWLRDGRVVSQSSQKHKRHGRLFEDSLVKCIIGPSTVMMERDLYLRNNGFREDLEIGEDYELWLKITASHDVAYLETPLTIKRGGHRDQLTQKYGYIEHFRIEALSGLLAGGFFGGDDRSAAANELLRKCQIYVAGARKRGKFEEAEKIEHLVKSLEME